MSIIKVNGSITYSDPSPGAGAGTFDFSTAIQDSPFWKAGFMVTKVELRGIFTTLGADSSGTISVDVSSNIGGGGTTSAFNQNTWAGFEGASANAYLDRTAQCGGKMLQSLTGLSSAVVIGISTGGSWISQTGADGLRITGYPVAAGMIHT